MIVIVQGIEVAYFIFSHIDSVFDFMKKRLQ